MIKAVIFDIDCTLVVTGGAGLKAFRRIMEERFGAGGTGPADYRFHGRTDLSIFHDFFHHATGREASSAEIDGLRKDYLAALPDEMERCRGNYRVLPGVEALLDFLAVRGVAVGLGTGNLEEAAALKLRPGGLDGRFSFGGYGSDSADRAEVLRMALRRAGGADGAPLDPREALFVGDTTRDIEAARAAGGWVLAVATGIQGVEELAAADCAVPTLEAPAVYEFLRDRFGLA